MGDPYKTPESKVQSASKEMSRLKFWVLIGIAFSIGSLICGISVFKFVKKEYEVNLDLIALTSDMATLDRDIRLLELNDSELRCKLSKLVAGEVNRFELEKLPVEGSFGAPGLPTFLNQQRDEALKHYNTTNINEYARECILNSKPH